MCMKRIQDIKIGRWERFEKIEFENFKYKSPEIPLNLTSEGLKFPPEVSWILKCSIVCGTPVQAILEEKNLTGLAGVVREGQNMAKVGLANTYVYMQNFWLRSPLEVP